LGDTLKTAIAMNAATENPQEFQSQKSVHKVKYIKPYPAGNPAQKLF